MIAFRRAGWCLAASCLVLCSALPAQAAIMNAGGGPATDNATACEVSNWNWTFAAAAEAGANRCAMWTVAPSSPAGAVVNGFLQKELTFDLQHRAAPHATEINPNPPNAAVTVDAGRFAAGVSRAGAYAISHLATNHRDIYQWRVAVPAVVAGSTIAASARHFEDVFQPAWSYTPAQGVPVNYGGVTATYRADPARPAEGVPQANQKVQAQHSGRLPNSATGQRPTDYHVQLSIGDPLTSDMTLGYVIGSAGSLELGELDVMNEVFSPGSTYFVPMLFDAAGTTDLYIAVDLTQWLSFPTSYMDGDVFSFTGGTSPLLAGIEVATSPFSFDPASGFVSANLWSGQAIVEGSVDGHNVPEPGSVGLLGMAAAMFLMERSRRSRVLAARAAASVAGHSVRYAAS